MKDFITWLKLREMIQPTDPTQATPNTQNAQDLTVDALKKMPMKPGQTPASALKDPKTQIDLLAAANTQAKQQGKTLNLGQAAQTIATPQAPGMTS